MSSNSYQDVLKNSSLGIQTRLVQIWGKCLRIEKKTSRLSTSVIHPIDSNNISDYLEKGKMMFLNYSIRMYLKVIL